MTESDGAAFERFGLEPLLSQLFLPLLANGQVATPPTVTPTPTPTLTATPTTPLIQDHRLGIVQTYDAPEVATAVGAGWTRVYFSWANLQCNRTELAAS